MLSEGPRRQKDRDVGTCQRFQALPRFLQSCFLFRFPVRPARGPRGRGSEHPDITSSLSDGCVPRASSWAGPGGGAVTSVRDQTDEWGPRTSDLPALLPIPRSIVPSPLLPSTPFVGRDNVTQTRGEDSHCLLRWGPAGSERLLQPRSGPDSLSSEEAGGASSPSSQACGRTCPGRGGCTLLEDALQCCPTVLPEGLPWVRDRVRCWAQSSE